VSVAPRGRNSTELSDCGKVVWDLVFFRRRRRNIRRMPSNRRRMMVPNTPPITTNVGEVLVDVLARPLLLDIGKRVEDPDTVGETWTVWT
jgi:hypothetical protein